MPRAPVTLETQRLLLTQPSPEDAHLVLAYYEENKQHLEPWEPSRPREFYTLAYWEERLARNREDFDHDKALRLFLLLKPDDPDHPEDEAQDIVGTCNFTEFVRGPSQRCSLGFGLHHRHEGRGLMREALARSLEFVLEDCGLHRVEAAYQPHNQRSGGLLRRLGFVVEGYARDYLRLDGAWRDHILTSKVGH
jgi:[ribosomal protein S5]-alanine N-acetyltransferase